jgi:hypothetical protein
MATVIYGFNAYASAGSHWTDPAYAVNGQDGNSGTAVYKISQTNRLRTSSNTAPGTDLGIITKREIGGYLWAIGDGYCWPCIQPVGSLMAYPFNWNESEFFRTLYVDCWYETWTWAQLPSLDIDCWGVSTEGDTAYNSTNWDWIWIRITYTPAPTGLDLKVHGADWSSIAKIHGMSESDIAKIHGAS